MPYKSEAQRKYFNVNRKKLEAQGVDVDEWNQASKGKKLPEQVKESSIAQLAKQADSYLPNTVHMQQFSPQMARRNFTKDEQAAISQGESQFLPVTSLTRNYGTPITAMLASPGKQGLLGGLGGSLLGGLLAAHYGRSVGLGAAVGGLGSGLASYLHRKKKNEDLKELMRRLPQGSTYRDLLSDSAYQKDLDRSNDMARFYAMNRLMRQSGYNKFAKNEKKALDIISRPRKTKSIPSGWEIRTFGESESKPPANTDLKTWQNIGDYMQAVHPKELETAQVFTGNVRPSDLVDQIQRHKFRDTSLESLIGVRDQIAQELSHVPGTAYEHVSPGYYPEVHGAILQQNSPGSLIQLLGNAINYGPKEKEIKLLRALKENYNPVIFSEPAAWSKGLAAYQKGYAASPESNSKDHDEYKKVMQSYYTRKYPTLGNTFGSVAGAGLGGLVGAIPALAAAENGEDGALRLALKGVPLGSLLGGLVGSGLGHYFGKHYGKIREKRDLIQAVKTIERLKENPEALKDIAFRLQQLREDKKSKNKVIEKKALERGHGDLFSYATQRILGNFNQLRPTNLALADYRGFMDPDDSHDLTINALEKAYPDALSNTKFRTHGTNFIDDYLWKEIDDDDNDKNNWSFRSRIGGRLLQNPRTSILTKGFGLAGSPMLYLSNLLNRSPHYDPFTDTINQSYNIPAVSQHELGHAADINSVLGQDDIYKNFWLKRQFTNLPRDIYTAGPAIAASVSAPIGVPILLGSKLIQEARANLLSDRGLKRQLNKKDYIDNAEHRFHNLPGAYSTYINSALNVALPKGTINSRIAYPATILGARLAALIPALRRRGREWAAKSWETEHNLNTLKIPQNKEKSKDKKEKDRKEKAASVLGLNYIPELRRF